MVVVDVKSSTLDRASCWRAVIGSRLGARRKPLSCRWADNERLWELYFILEASIDAPPHFLDVDHVSEISVHVGQTAATCLRRVSS